MHNTELNNGWRQCSFCAYSRPIRNISIQSVSLAPAQHNLVNKSRPSLFLSARMPDGILSNVKWLHPRASFMSAEVKPKKTLGWKLITFRDKDRHTLGLNKLRMMNCPCDSNRYCRCLYQDRGLKGQFTQKFKVCDSKPVYDCFISTTQNNIFWEMPQWFCAPYKGSQWGPNVVVLQFCFVGWNDERILGERAGRHKTSRNINNMYDLTDFAKRDLEQISHTFLF